MDEWFVESLAHAEVAWGTVSSTISKLDFPPSIKKQGILHNIVIPKKYHTIYYSQGRKNKEFCYIRITNTWFRNW
jgi:hypothetical protein